MSKSAEDCWREVVRSEKGREIWNTITMSDYQRDILYRQMMLELIVQECLDIAEQTHETKYGKMSCANDDETVRLIKERFGIE
jgi:hypothetical protein